MLCSQEVVWRPPIYVSEIVLFRCRVELQERVLHELVHFHDGRLVTATVAVIWRGEHGDHVPVVRPVVAVHYQLVGASYQLQVVRVVELFRYVLAEGVACTSWRDAPTHFVFRVRPQQVTHWSVMRHFNLTV